MTDSFTLKKIAAYLNGEMLSGNPDALVGGVSSLEKAKSSDICYYGNTKYLSMLSVTNALAVISSKPVETSASCVIQVKDSYDSFRKVLELFKPDRSSGFLKIHDSAVIHPSSIIGDKTEVGPSVTIDRDCSIGINCLIASGVSIGPSVSIGDDCVIHTNVSIESETVIGNEVIIHSGSVLGSDGFGFVPDLGGKHKKIPQNGNVVIGNSVEIGANCTIDRAVTDSTSIGDFTKLDNLIQIAHNVKIGKSCFIAAQTGIAGSTTVGNGVVFGGQVGVAGHIVIADGVVIAAKSGVTKSIKNSGITVSGNPARLHSENLRLNAALNRLPDIIKKSAR